VPLDRVRLTAAKSVFGRHRKLRLARPQGSAPVSASDDELRLARPRARTWPGPRKTTNSASQGSDSASAPEDDELRLARPQGSDSASTPEDDELRLARPQGSDSALASDDGLRPARPGARTRPRPRKTDSTSTSEEPPPRPTQGSDRPRHRGGIIILPLASSGYREQDRRPIWLAGKQIMMAPHVLHNDGGSQPLTEARRCQQGLDSPDSCPSARLQCSSDGHDIT
jgi:hypothetical protein